MRKILSVMLTLALCCMLIPAVAEDASLAGTWYLVKGANGDQELQVVDPEAISVVLHEDGTALLSMAAYGVSKECTWSAADSVLTLDSGVEGEDPMTLAIEDGQLAFSLGASKAYLSRTAAEPFVLPEAVTAESAEAFNGTWIPFAQMAMGLFYTMSEEEIAAAGILELDNGKITVNYIGEDGQAIPANVYEGSFADGLLTAVDESFGTSTMTVTLLEDGSLRYDTVSILGTFTFFYTLAEETAE